MKRPARDWAFFFAALTAFIVVVFAISLLFSHLAARHSTIFKEGYDVGLEEGLGRSDYSQYSQGYSEGQKDAYHAFSKEDYSDGYEAGFDSGKERGYDDGYSDGYSDGHEDGYTEGYDRGEIAGEEYAKDLLYTDEDGEVIRDTSRIRIEVLHEFNSLISDMQIPNPLNPGHCFENISDLYNYSLELHGAAGN